MVMGQQRVDSNLLAVPKLFVTDWKMHKEMESQSTLEPCFCSLSTPTLVDGLPVALDPK
jgi:hypothetical protein